MTITPEIIKRGLCDLSAVEQTALGFEITLAQIYSNGDVVTISVQAEGSGFNVHDAGNAAMILENAGVSVSSKLQSELRAGVEAYGAQIARFRVSKQCPNPNDIAATAAIVGCASRFVADHSFKSEGHPIFDFRRELIETLCKSIGSPRVRENEEIVARTGTRYQVSATILDEQGSRPIAYLEAISGHQSVARKFRALYDLKHTPVVAETRRFSIIDNSRPGITTGDIELLNEVSEALPFTERGKLVSEWAAVD